MTSVPSSPATTARRRAMARFMATGALLLDVGFVLPMLVPIEDTMQSASAGIWIRRGAR